MSERILNGFVDARCMCKRCEARTTNVYRMVGCCTNCHAQGILILNRAGDEAARVQCPLCAVSRAVMQQRLATADEIPSAVPTRAAVPAPPTACPACGSTDPDVRGSEPYDAAEGTPYSGHYVGFQTCTDAWHGTGAEE